MEDKIVEYHRELLHQDIDSCSPRTEGERVKLLAKYIKKLMRRRIRGLGYVQGYV